MDYTPPHSFLGVIQMIYVIRAVFLILVSTVASIYLWATISNSTQGALETKTEIAYGIMVGGVVLAFLMITVDILVRHKNLSTLSGLLFGVMVGMLLALGIGYLIEQATNIYMDEMTKQDYKPLIEGTKLLIALMTCYICVSFIFQTKDDFRFIIPYVEFSRATKGPRPMILDTSRDHRRPHRGDGGYGRLRESDHCSAFCAQ